jgi:hypothetical protein
MTDQRPAPDPGGRLGEIRALLDSYKPSARGALTPADFSALGTQLVPRVLYLLDLVHRQQAMLTRLEWVDANWDGRGFCAICRRDERDGHKTDCQLAALLRELDGAAGEEGP